MIQTHVLGSNLKLSAHTTPRRKPLGKILENSAEVCVRPVEEMQRILYLTEVFFSLSTFFPVHVVMLLSAR